jgi:hypothetical protein
LQLIVWKVLILATKYTGEIYENWINYDAPALMQQIGAVNLRQLIMCTSTVVPSSFFLSAKSIHPRWNDPVCSLPPLLGAQAVRNSFGDPGF